MVGGLEMVEGAVDRRGGDGDKERVVLGCEVGDAVGMMGFWQWKLKWKWRWCCGMM